jgi:hypothetical protein
MSPDTSCIVRVNPIDIMGILVRPNASAVLAYQMQIIRIEKLIRSVAERSGADCYETGNSHTHIDLRT